MAVGASCTWQVDFLCCHTRAAQCERATFLVADFGGFVVHPFPDVNPSLPPAVHYLNKQAGRRGRLAAACTPSLPPSLFLYNKCASRFSLHFLVSSLRYIQLSFSSSHPPSLSLSHARARSRNVTVTNNYPFHVEARRESR